MDMHDKILSWTGVNHVPGGNKANDGGKVPVSMGSKDEVFPLIEGRLSQSLIATLPLTSKSLISTSHFISVGLRVFSTSGHTVYTVFSALHSCSAKPQL